MSRKQLIAHFENREYYFYLTERNEKAVSIDMYNTPYTFIIVNDVWENHNNNKNNMAKGLIHAVIETIQKNQ